MLPLCLLPVVPAGAVVRAVGSPLQTSHVHIFLCIMSLSICKPRCKIFQIQYKQFQISYCLNFFNNMIWYLVSYILLMQVDVLNVFQVSWHQGVSVTSTLVNSSFCFSVDCLSGRFSPSFLNPRDNAKRGMFCSKVVPLFSIFYVKVWSLSVTKKFQVYIWPNLSWNHYLNDALVQTGIVACGNVWLISWLSVKIKLLGAKVDWIYFKKFDSNITHLNTKKPENKCLSDGPKQSCRLQTPFVFHLIWLIFLFYLHPQPSFFISGTSVHHGLTHHQMSGGFPAALRSFWSIWW